MKSRLLLRFLFLSLLRFHFIRFPSVLQFRNKDWSNSPDLRLSSALPVQRMRIKLFSDTDFLSCRAIDTKSICDALRHCTSVPMISVQIEVISCSGQCAQYEQCNRSEANWSTSTFNKRQKIVKIIFYRCSRSFLSSVCRIFCYCGKLPVNNVLLWMQLFRLDSLSIQLLQINGLINIFTTLRMWLTIQLAFSHFHAYTI